MKRNSKDFTDNQHNNAPGQDAGNNSKPADGKLHLEDADAEVADVDPEEGDMEEVSEETSELESLRSLLQTKEEEVAKEKKEYMFLMAEFDNFRKRTLKEKSEIIKNAGEQVFKGLLPILDDFERGIEAASKTDNADSVKEGMVLIYNKFKKYLEQNGVKEMDTKDADFDTERHEAISVVPVAEDSRKGKVLDTVQKGYTINDKVLRHAKVVVGQ